MKKGQKKRKWFYTAGYLLFVIISFLPLITETGYSPEKTQDVIIQLLKVSTAPYKQWGFMLHIGTVLLIGLIAVGGRRTSRIFSMYIAINYFVIAFVQSFGETEKYGAVIHTGGLAGSILLGLIWVWAAYKDDTHAQFKRMTWYQYALLPLALLAFWAPYRIVGEMVVADFNPMLLLNSPDYGLTFCLTTPVFLYLLVLFFPDVNLFAYRMTAFNGLLYGLFNLSHWFNPDTRWMGVLHIPLLAISIFSLWQSSKKNKIART